MLQRETYHLSCNTISLGFCARLLEFKTDSAKDFWGWDEKLELLECYEDWREWKELTAELLEVILRCSVTKKLSPNKKVLNKSPCILNVSRSRM